MASRRTTSRLQEHGEDHEGTGAEGQQHELQHVKQQDDEDQPGQTESWTSSEKFGRGRWDNVDSGDGDDERLIVLHFCTGRRGADDGERSNWVLRERR
ncbi:hypothetical protein COP2_044724 [Malus domestica]